jgi:hypothetical protein
VSEIDAYVADHNIGVRTGHWSRFAAWFTDDAEVRFKGVPVGPFRGRGELRLWWDGAHIRELVITFG